VKLGREGPTVPVQLRGGLRSPNWTVTRAGNTIIRMAGAPHAHPMPLTPPTMSESYAPSTVGHQLRPKNLDITCSREQQMVGEPTTPY
jgi:hypothetical protein